MPNYKLMPIIKDEALMMKRGGKVVRKNKQKTNLKQSQRVSQKVIVNINSRSRSRARRNRRQTQGSNAKQAELVTLYKTHVDVNPNINDILNRLQTNSVPASVSVNPVYQQQHSQMIGDVPAQNEADGILQSVMNPLKEADINRQLKKEFDSVSEVTTTTQPSVISQAFTNDIHWDNESEVELPNTSYLTPLRPKNLSNYDGSFNMGRYLKDNRNTEEEKKHPGTKDRGERGGQLGRKIGISAEEAHRLENERNNLFKSIAKDEENNIPVSKTKYDRVKYLIEKTQYTGKYKYLSQR